MKKSSLLMYRLPLWPGQVGGEEQDQQRRGVHSRRQHHHRRRKGLKCLQYFVLSDCSLSRLPALWRPSTRSRSTGSPSPRNGQQITGNLPGNHLSKFFRTLTPLRCLFSILNPLNSTEIFVFSLNTTVDYEKLVPGLKLTLDSSFKPDTGAKVGRFLSWNRDYSSFSFLTWFF